MKTEKEVRSYIKDVVKANKHILDLPLATVVENAPRALMQLSAVRTIEVLYFVLEETRPQFKCDDQGT